MRQSVYILFILKRVYNLQLFFIRIDKKII